MRVKFVIFCLIAAVLCWGVGCEGFGSYGSRPITAKCYFGLEDDASTLAATITETTATVRGKETIYVRLAMDPAFVDNTYGATAIGWEESKKGTHQFKELVGSDHAELMLYDKVGDLVLHFKLDYLSEADGTGEYRSLGVSDGDGELFEGEASAIVAYTTSMDRNFNEHGYSQYTVDSPATNASYTEKSAAPNWEYLVTYEVWVDTAAFAPHGFGRAEVEYIHASPSKKKNNTIVVEQDDCPDTTWDDNQTTEPEESNDESEVSKGPQPPVV